MFLDNIPVFGSTDLLILILAMIDVTVYSMSSQLETCTICCGLSDRPGL